MFLSVVFNHQSIWSFSSGLEFQNIRNEKGTHLFIVRFPELSRPSIRESIWGSEGFQAHQCMMVLCWLTRTISTYINAKGFFIFLSSCRHDQIKYLSQSLSLKHLSLKILITISLVILHFIFIRHITENRHKPSVIISLDNFLNYEAYSSS